MVINLDGKDREEIEKIIAAKIEEALADDGIIRHAMQMDERFVYVGKEIFAIQNGVKRLREDLNKLLERDVLRALERLKQDTE